MDIRGIKQVAIELRMLLQKNHVRAECIILFGSYSKQQAHEQSDIDLAIISRDFGKDRFSESVLLNRLAVKVHSDIEAIPIGLKDFLDPDPVSPILHEIKSTGTILI